MNIKRFYSSVSLPWKFSNRDSPVLQSMTPKLRYELDEEENGFISAFRRILVALEEQNIKFLKECMEPNLFKSCTSAFEALNKQGQQIKVLNKGAHTVPLFYADCIYMGLNIIRSENSWTYMNLPLYSWARKLKFSKDERVEICSFKLDSILLKIDVLFNSASKIVVVGKKGEIIEGESSTVNEIHHFRFEKFSNLPNAIGNKTNVLDDVYLYYWDSPMYKNKLRELFAGAEWMITDIDNCLEGNPYK